MQSGESRGGPAEESGVSSTLDCSSRWVHEKTVRRDSAAVPHNGGAQQIMYVRRDLLISDLLCPRYWSTFAFLFLRQFSLRRMLPDPLSRQRGLMLRLGGRHPPAFGPWRTAHGLLKPSYGRKQRHHHFQGYRCHKSELICL